MTIKLIIFSIIALISGAIAVEGFMRRGKSKKSLAERVKPNYGAKETASGEVKVPLGMEAIDMSIIKDAERLNNNIDHRNPNLKRRK